MPKIITIDTIEELSTQLLFNIHVSDDWEEYTGTVYLFLDFDGVLHSFESYYTKKNLFNKKYLLEDIMKAMPNVKIVVSSSWAKRYTLNELKLHFDESIRDNIVGSIKKQSDNRHDDVLEYINTRGIQAEPWVALDDMAVYDKSDPIVRTDWRVGLTPEVCSLLKKALKYPIHYKNFKENLNV